jgi:hypothetical protein
VVVAFPPPPEVPFPGEIGFGAGRVTGEGILRMREREEETRAVEPARERDGGRDASGMVVGVGIVGVDSRGGGAKGGAGLRVGGVSDRGETSGDGDSGGCESGEGDVGFGGGGRGAIFNPEGSLEVMTVISGVSTGGSEAVTSAGRVDMLLGVPSTGAGANAGGISVLTGVCAGGGAV